VPLGVNPDVLNRFSGYPSDHAAVLFGLVATIFLVNRALGAAALLWAALLALIRIYELYHYPSDIVAGAALGVLIVCLALSSRRLTIGAAHWRILAARAPAAWVAGAFLFSFMVSDLFADVRRIGRVLAKSLLVHAGLS
jgi:undecaprenyl-diphosphatase